MHSGRLRREKRVFTCVSNEKALLVEKDKSYFVRSLWSVSLGDISNELSFEQNTSPERDKVC